MEQNVAQVYEAAIDTDIRCISCGYSLLGLSPSGVCPECGTNIADSSRGTLLAYSSDEHLKSLHQGVVLILAAIAIQLVVQIVGSGVTAAAAAARVGNQQFLSQLTTASTIVLTVVSVVLLYGWWLFSKPDPAYEGMDEGQTPRRLIRVMVVVQLALTPLAFLNASAPTASTQFLLAAIAIGAISMIPNVILFFASMLYTRWLGHRIPNARVIKRARTLMWLGPVLMTVGAIILIGPLIAIVLHWNMFDWVRKDLKRIRKAKLEAEVAGLVPASAGV